MRQQDSLLNKSLGLTLALLSLIMIGIIGIKWIRSSQKVQVLTIATAGKNGTYYNFAVALAEVVEKHNPKIKIKVLETEGSRQNATWLEEKKVDLALLQSDTPLNSESKAISFLFPEFFHLVVNDESKINKFSDLKGKRIGLMPEGSGSYALFWPLSKHYGLRKDIDIAVRVTTFEAASLALIENQVDAIFFIGALGGKQVTKLLQENDRTKLVEISQGAALKLYLPSVESTIIPKGTYSGAVPIPSKNLPSIAVRAMLFAHQDLDVEIAYEITRILYEARNDFLEKYPQAALIPKPDQFREGGFSFHQGASTYYNKDRPSFLLVYAEPMGLLLSVIVLCTSGIWQLRTWLQINQKNRADSYNLEIIRLTKQINTIENLAELASIREQLFEILEKVIVDLDRDRISAESFQSFTFPWEVALSTLRHRENLLISKS